MKALIVRITQQPNLETIWYFNQVGAEYICQVKHPYNSWYSVIQQGEVQDRGFVIHEDDAEVIREVEIRLCQSIEII